MYQPETDEVVPILQDPLLGQSPKSMRICRVYGQSDKGREEIVVAFNKIATGAVDELTNV